MVHRVKPDAFALFRSDAANIALASVETCKTGYLGLRLRAKYGATLLVLLLIHPMNFSAGR